MSKYKKIVLLKGLEGLSDYRFRTIKSLLKEELQLTEEMQENCDRIKMADLMKKKFPKLAGLDKLIEVCQDIKDLKDLVKTLKTEKAKVEKQKKGKNKTAMKKRKQDEPSSSQSLSTNNESNKSKHSSKKKRKQTIKTEGGKKKKLIQEQTQLLEPSGSNTQKDEYCLQNSHKSQPTPFSSSSCKKNTSIKKPSTIKTQVSQKEHQLPELSATSNSSAGSELQTLQSLSATAASSLQTPQKHLETRFTLKSSPGSPAPPCRNFPVSPASDSSIHLNSQVPLTLSSGVQAPHVPSATASGSIWVSHMPSERVSSSLNTPQISPVSVSSSTQNIHLSTTAAHNSKQSPHSPQVITSRPAQTPRGPSATLENKAWVGMMPPATACNNIQVPHALPEAVPRNDCSIQMPQSATSSGIQTLNTATVKAPTNGKVPGLLEPGGPYFLASPATTSSSLQASQLLPSTASNTHPAPRVFIPIGTSSVQTTQTHPGATSKFIQVLHAPAQTEFRSVCTTTQVPQGVVTSIGQALPCRKVTASTSVHAPQMSSATASKVLPAPCASLLTASSSLLGPRVSPATAFSVLQDHLMPPASTSSSPLQTPERENFPRNSSKEGLHQDPKEVMVLKVTEAFTYDLINDKRMFHATVATETEFFRVKVFDMALKNKFIPKKIIAISDYHRVSGFLEIYEASCVSDVNINRKMVISNTLRQRANGTPKIEDLFSQKKGTYVNGEFVVTEKNERNDFIYYGIEDNTGKMEVVVSGQLTSIKCEPGNKLQLVCFELTSSEDMWQLKSVKHSYIQVINARKRVTEP